MSRPGVAQRQNRAPGQGTSATDVPGDVDLLVVGAGAGGLTAALVAAKAGLRVLLCEASQQVGGTTATSAGTVWVPGNTPGRHAGHGDTVAAGARYLDAVVGPDADGVRQAFLERAPEAFDYLMGPCGIPFAPAALHPDYLEAPGAAQRGRAMAPLPFDGRLLGADFARVRAPLPAFLVLGSMMVGKADVDRLLRRYRRWPDFLFAAGLFARWARDRLRHARGTRLVMGNALVARLLQANLATGTQVRYGLRATGLCREDGRVVGACLQSQDGARHDVRATRGVALATGGFGQGSAWREHLMGDLASLRSLVFEGCQGDGLTMAQAVDGVIDTARHRPAAFWQPVSVMPRGQGREALFPHLAMDRGKPGLIAVLPSGRRFVNEGASYHHFVQAMLAADPGARTPAWLICSAGFVRRYGLGAIRPGTRRLTPHVRSGYLLRASSLAALAQQAGIDAATLQATVAAYDADAARGEDPAFGKGHTVLSRFNGDAQHGPNPGLAPLGKGPYCALRVWPADAASGAGLRTDPDARVLDSRGAAIPGLYACGNDMASVMGSAYPGPGITLGPAMTFAYLAARHAAQGDAGDTFGTGR